MNFKVHLLKDVATELKVSPVIIIQFLRKRGHKMVNSHSTEIPDHLFQLLKISEVKISERKHRLSSIAKEFGIKISSITDYLKRKGYVIENNPMTKVSHEIYELLKEAQLKNSQIDENVLLNLKTPSHLSNEESKMLKLSHVAKEFNISIATIVQFLQTKGERLSIMPMTKLSPLQYQLVEKEYHIERENLREAKTAKNHPKAWKLPIVKKEKKTSVNNKPLFLKVVKEEKKSISKSKRPRILVKKDEFSTSKSNPVLKEKELKNSNINHTYFINFRSNKVYLGREKILRLSDLELPSYINPFPQPMSWLIRVIKFHPNTGVLKAQILSFHKGIMDFTQEQSEDLETLKDINSISFERTDRDALDRSVKGLQTAETVYPQEVQDNKSEISKATIKDNSLSEEKIITISDTVYISFSDLEFKDGEVCFKYKYSRIRKELLFRIFNPYLKKEFEFVKNYFPKALGVKQIKVDLTVETSGHLVKSYSATSPEISKINPTIISQVRISFLKKALNGKNESNDSLTQRQFFENAGVSKLNEFYLDDNGLLEDLMEIKSTKHKNHLKYLASKQSNLEKIRFLFKPFSFVFLIERSGFFYAVWETLTTSEATYVWPIKKELFNLAENYQAIQALIISIKEGKKTVYIETTDHEFHRIRHDYSEANDGFPKWQMEIEKLLK
ncbi:MAG: type restriction protein res subunit [Bacteroidetes bacterium]|jgi:hypothetical protein|nr:type restriction protein res subunit [Bacteroidota bacterium]